MKDEKLHLFGEYELDLARGCLLHAGRPVHLRPQAYRALEYLADNRGRLVSKDRLIEEVWEGRAVTDDSLVQCLRDVRQALGAGARYLRNERGRGYIFDPPTDEPSSPAGSQVWTEQVDLVRVVVEDDEAADEESRPPLLPGATTSAVGYRPGRAIAVTAACLLALCLVAGAAYFLFRPNAGRPAADAGLRSLAVLPFKPLVPEGRDEALEVGMADTLIARLSNIGDVTVRPLSAVRRYRGLEQDPAAAGKQLGVEAVLDGTIHRSGERVGVMARIIAVSDGRQLWADRFDEKFTDIFTVQDMISERVAAALALKLTGEKQRQLTRHDTEDAEAYQRYLYGRFYRNKRTEAAMKMAIQYFEQAIALDPNYALAHAGLSEGYVGLAVFGATPPRDVLPKARAAARKALEFGDEVAESHVAMAHFKAELERDWSGAEREYQRAIELNPGYADAYRLYAILLMAGGRADEAFARIHHALKIDPTSVVHNYTLGLLYYWARRYDQAVEQLQKTIDLEPGHWVAHYYLAQVYALTGRHDQAVLEAQKARDLSGDPASSWILGYVYARARRQAEARQQINELIRLSKQQYVSSYDIAQIYAGLGDKDQALAWLEKAYKDQARGIDYLSVNPAFDPIRSDARFTALAKRVGR